jgi:hypothetical protein
MERMESKMSCRHFQKMHILTVLSGPAPGTLSRRLQKMPIHHGCMRRSGSLSLFSFGPTTLVSAFGTAVVIGRPGNPVVAAGAQPLRVCLLGDRRGNDTTWKYTTF